jgi:hypothetical protein
MSPWQMNQVTADTIRQTCTLGAGRNGAYTTVLPTCTCEHTEYVEQDQGHGCTLHGPGMCVTRVQLDTADCAVVFATWMPRTLTSVL